MNESFGRVRLRYGLFLAAALAINLIDGAVVRAAADAGQRLVLGLASSFDVIGTVALLYYLLLVRPGIRTKASVLGVALLGAMRASLLFPAGGRGRMVVWGICQAVLLGGVMYLVRRMRGANRDGGDPLVGIGAAIECLVPSRVAARALTAELGILYYALFAWRAQPHVPDGTRAVTNYQKAGRADLLSVLPLACAVEIVPVHVVLSRWSAGLAWVATAISFYGIVWLAGLARSFRLRPTLIGADSICIRYGCVFQLRVAREKIASVRRAKAGDDRWAAPGKAQPTHAIAFTEEVRAERLFGFTKRVKRLALAVDDAAVFEEALGAHFE